jgi:hypothetical protein
MPTFLSPGPHSAGDVRQPLDRCPQGPEHGQDGLLGRPATSLLPVGVGQLDAVKACQLAELKDKGLPGRDAPQRSAFPGSGASQRSSSTRFRMPWIGILTQSGLLLIS